MKRLLRMGGLICRPALFGLLLRMIHFCFMLFIFSLALSFIMQKHKLVVRQHALIPEASGRTPRKHNLRSFFLLTALIQVTVWIGAFGVLSKCKEVAVMGIAQALQRGRALFGEVGSHDLVKERRLAVHLIFAPHHQVVTLSR